MTLQNYILDCLRAAGLRVIEIESVQCVVGQICNQGEWVTINRSREHTHTNIEPDEPK